MQRLMLCSVLVMLATNAQALECVVNDPTGTPLNVRDSPNGRILGALYNGVQVNVVRRSGSWAYIVPQRGESGWVFSDYLDCP
jgi:uncharacterized protein YraI